MMNKFKKLQEKFTNYCLVLALELRGSYKKIIASLKKLSSRATTTQNSNAAGLLNTQVESTSDSIKAERRHSLMTKVFFGFGIAVLLLLLYYARQNDHPKEDKESKVPLKLEVASQALDIDKMWRNHFEDKLIQNKSVTEAKMQELKNTLDETTVAHQSQFKTEIEALNAKIKFLTDEHFSTKTEIGEIKLKSKAVDVADQAHNEQITQSRINVNDMGRGEVFDRPKSSRNFIPETAYVKGVLLGGISVSTALGSSAEPVPVVIRITHAGSLPKNFNINLKHCQIMGSSYGDLSSERAIIRAEVLSCQDHKQELIYTTKIAGIIHGDDGMNGIKGKVVQTSGKHLKNAMIGSMISGFASSAKGQDQFSITSFGGINTQKKGMGTMVQEGSLTGASNAAEKLADYYIKQAEAMSPVLMVPGGVQVDVVFTKGVYLGALDVQEKLEQIRNSKGEKK